MTRAGLGLALDDAAFVNPAIRVAAASSSEQPAKKPSIAADLVSGTVAGISQLCVGHPFDTIKVKLQNMPATVPGQAPMYTSALDATRKTVAAEGMQGLYAGISAPMAFVAVFNAVLFAANATMRKLVGKGRHVDELSLTELATCGMGAGFAVSWVACPTELVKCRLQSQGPTAIYSGPIDCARQVVAARGFAGLYKGMGATLAREVPANAIYFGTYEASKRAFTPKGQSTDSLGATALVVSGGLAGVGFWASVYPIDVIKTRIQTDSDVKPRYRGMVDCARQMVRAEGIGALYKGVGPCLARAFPANGVTFLVFEWMRGILATN